ncbi:MAG TPA: glycosyltransferase family A protein [Allosphingosinicella sp.]|nr:glycosyltransferase family A protein [Allosphingosinicella sp.]
MSGPPLSVVMPVHNGMPYVEDSVRSVLAQSFTDFEFVIGDDGSTDGTGETLERWEARDARIRLLRRDRKSGLAASANWVAGAASAPLVAIVHADDLSHPDRFARQVALFRSQADLALVGTLWEGIDEAGRRVRPGDYWKLLRRSPFVPFSHSSVMFRRAAFDTVRGYRPEAEYWEDLDLYIRMSGVGRVAVIPEVLAAVRHSRISARFHDDPARVENAVDLMYRATECFRRSIDYGPLLHDDRTLHRKLHPLTFVSCGSTMLWSGRSPRTMARMVARARLRLDSLSLHALAWVTWGTISPKSLRFVLRTLMQIRNAVARIALRGRKIVDWPVPGAVKAPRTADRPAPVQRFGDLARLAEQRDTGIEQPVPTTLAG